MKIIVDANIVFSGILNANGRIGDMLINNSADNMFISPEFLRSEISNHYTKLVKISKRTLPQIIESEYRLCKHVNFISEEQIAHVHWQEANKLVFDIDPNDVVYIAYALHFQCKLWSGDKVLMKGLAKKGFLDVVNTNDLHTLLTTK